MSYAIASVFYGVPATKELRLKAWELDEGELEGRPGGDSSEDERESWGAEVLEEYGFHAPYSGSGNPDSYLGVDLPGFDECEPTKRLAEYIQAPSSKQREEFEVMLEELPDWLQLACRPNVDIWVIWGSS